MSARTYDLVSFGWVREDVFLSVDQIPEPDHGLEVSESLEYVSGDAAIVALRAADLGLRVALCGNALGQDTRGSRIIQTLAERRIDCYLTQSLEHSPYNVVVQDSQGQRTWFGLHCSRARDSTRFSSLEPIHQSKMVYVDGYLGEASDKAAQAARATDTPFVLNLPAPDATLGAVASLLPKHLAGHDPVKFLRQHAAKKPTMTIVTAGELGAFFSAHGEIHRIDSHRVSVVSPSGAGASFAAGICFSLLQGRSLEELARFATACAALHCSSSPDGVLSVDEIRRLEAEKIEWRRLE